MPRRGICMNALDLHGMPPINVQRRIFLGEPDLRNAVGGRCEEWGCTKVEEAAEKR